jgi:hypothetical protein
LRFVPPELRILRTIGRDRLKSAEPIRLRIRSMLALRTRTSSNLVIARPAMITVEALFIFSANKTTGVRKLTIKIGKSRKADEERYQIEIGNTTRRVCIPKTIITAL